MFCGVVRGISDRASQVVQGALLGSSFNTICKVTAKVKGLGYTTVGVLSESVPNLVHCRGRLLSKLGLSEACGQFLRRHVLIMKHLQHEPGA